MKPIPYGRQHITDADIQEVVRTLQSEYLTQGPKIHEFELAFAKYVGADFAVAVSNGTAALHLSCIALNVNLGQKVITSPITFAASANCIRYCGGDVVFSDIDHESFTLDIAKVKLLLESSPKGTYSGIIPVDFAGYPVNLEEMKCVCDEFDLWIIEDACHAPGGYFVDKKGVKQRCGNGAFANVSIFSFHPVKHIATGEGGMVTTNDENLYQRLLLLRSHGITRNQESFINPVSMASGQDGSDDYPGWYMEMQELGYNYRLTDFQSALGLSQLKRANSGIVKRREIAAKYYKAFKDQTEIIRQSGIEEGHAYHLYVLEVTDRLGLYNFLKEHNIHAQIHYIPIHLMPYYKEQGYSVGNFPKAEAYYKNCISLPMYPSLSNEEQNFVIDRVLKFLNG